MTPKLYDVYDVWLLLLFLLLRYIFLPVHIFFAGGGGVLKQFDILMFIYLEMFKLKLSVTPLKNWYPSFWWHFILFFVTPRPHGPQAQVVMHKQEESSTGAGWKRRVYFRLERQFVVKHFGIINYWHILPAFKNMFQYPVNFERMNK